MTQVEAFDGDWDTKHHKHHPGMTFGGGDFSRRFTETRVIPHRILRVRSVARAVTCPPAKPPRRVTAPLHPRSSRSPGRLTRHDRTATERIGLIAFDFVGLFFNLTWEGHSG